MRFSQGDFFDLQSVAKHGFRVGVSAQSVVHRTGPGIRERGRTILGAEDAQPSFEHFFCQRKGRLVIALGLQFAHFFRELFAMLERLAVLCSQFGPDIDLGQRQPGVGHLPIVFAELLCLQGQDFFAQRASDRIFFELLMQDDGGRQAVG